MGKEIGDIFLKWTGVDMPEADSKGNGCHYLKNIIIRTLCFEIIEFNVKSFNDIEYVINNLAKNGFSYQVFDNKLFFTKTIDHIEENLVYDMKLDSIKIIEDSVQEFKLFEFISDSFSILLRKKMTLINP